MILTADNLACDRGGRTVFRGLGFSLARSQLMQLTGPNGSGKSTLLRLIAGLNEAAAGTLAATAVGAESLTTTPVRRADRAPHRQPPRDCRAVRPGTQEHQHRPHRQAVPLDQHAVVRADFEQSKQVAALKRPLLTSGRMVFSRQYGVLWQIDLGNPNQTERSGFTATSNNARTGTATDNPSTTVR